MDDLFLSKPTRKSHITKLEDLFKALLKNGLKHITQKGVYLLEMNCNICEILYLLRIEEK